MKKCISRIFTVCILAALGTLGAFADDLDALAGKWVAEKNEAQGQAFKHVLEIKKNKFTFQALREGGQVALYAEGEVKAEPLGPFKSAKFFNIQGGSSATDLQSVDDERTVIYLLDGSQMTVAVNFDREREEPPAVTKYLKQAAADEPKTLVIDKIVMHKTPQTSAYYLCFDATVGETTKRYNVADKSYEKDGLTIATDLSIPNVRKGQTCKFVMKLDDVAGDECGEDMDNRSAGSLTITESGAVEFKPEDGWRYTISWHLK